MVDDGYSGRRWGIKFRGRRDRGIHGVVSAAAASSHQTAGTVVVRGGRTAAAGLTRRCRGAYTTRVGYPCIRLKQTKQNKKKNQCII